MPIVSNSSGSFSPSAYVVAPTSPAGNYTTIAAAIAAADGNGGGTVYVQPGTYTESDTFVVANIVSVQAAAVLGEPIGSAVFSVIMNGNQSYSGTGAILWSGIEFTASSGVLWTIGSAGSNSAVEFQQCALANSGGSCISLNVAETTPFVMNDCQGVSSSSFLSAVGGAISINNSDLLAVGGDTISLGAASSLTLSISTVSSESGNSVTIAATNASLDSSFNDLIAALSSINYSAAGSAISVDDQMNASNGNTYAVTGAAGTLNYGNIIMSGSAQNINPAITATAYSSLPPSGQTYLTWQAISASQAISVAQGYIITSGAVSLSLPATSAVGNIFSVLLAGGTSWTITQGAGQQVRIGDVTSTSGAGGYVESSQQGDAVNFVCSVANTTWVAYAGPEGNILLN